MNSYRPRPAPCVKAWVARLPERVSLFALRSASFYRQIINLLQHEAPRHWNPEPHRRPPRQLPRFKKLFPEARSELLPLRPRASSGRRSDLNHSSWPTQSLNPISYTLRLLNGGRELKLFTWETFWQAAVSPSGSAMAYLRGGYF